VRRTLADRYDIEHVLGRGTMSDVFFGRERTGSRPVAVKVLRPEFAVTMVGDRFHREIAILARLQHPNILPLIASGESGGLVFYVMPCASGGTLKARLDSERQLSLDLRLRYREGDARGCR
jgi:serine/threonine-protein kinase